jgi:hypothetical protein
MESMVLMLTSLASDRRIRGHGGLSALRVRRLGPAQTLPGCGIQFRPTFFPFRLLIDLFDSLPTSETAGFDLMIGL